MDEGKEIPDISEALVSWFQSQEVSPQMATATMIYTVAVITSTLRDKGSEEAVWNYSNALCEALGR